MNAIRSGYRYLYKKVSNTKHRLFVDMTAYTVAAYFGLKKLLGISATEFLKKIFTEESGGLFATLLLCVVLYAIFMKGLLLVCDAFPGDRVRLRNAIGLSHCCLRINDEISEHLNYLKNNPQRAKETFLENHNFTTNVTMVAGCLHEHIVNSLEGARSRDVFLSLYTTSNFELDQQQYRFNYLLHEPIRRDVITNRYIDVNDTKFEKYECIKCLNSSKNTWILYDCKDYYRSDSKRHKKIKYYIGMKIMVNGIVVGFLNIELYNTIFFTSEEEIVDYLEDQLLPYKYLLEYQFLKRTFFTYINANLVSDGRGVI